MALHDKEIERLFHQGLGAHKIAHALGIKHYATVSKRLIRLGLRRPNSCVDDQTKLKIKLNPKPENLRKAAEHLARYFFTLRGYPVLVPESGAPYDLIVEFNGFQKIQVKSSTCLTPSGNYIFQLRRTRNNTNGSRRNVYSSDECDYFFLLDFEGSAWLIPFEKLKHSKGVTPAFRFPGYQVM